MKKKIQVNFQDTSILKLILLLLFLIIILGACFRVFSFTRNFLYAAQISGNEATNIVKNGWAKKPFMGNKVNFLILGLDQRSDALEHTLLTDSIIFASLDYSNKKFTLVPLPRDLWINDLKTKINALYYYGEKRPEGGLLFTGNEISKILGQPINYEIILNYNQLPVIIDLIGGIDVNIVKGFVDQKFPSSKFINSEIGESEYMTVTFSAGWQHFDGERCLQFVRSRQSEDLEEGNDSARNLRQLQVFQAMIAKLSSKKILSDPVSLGRIYRFWKEKVKTNLEDSDLIALGLITFPKGFPDLVIKSIPSPKKGETKSLLVNPPLSKYGQWVLEPADNNWVNFQEFINKIL